MMASLHGGAPLTALKAMPSTIPAKTTISKTRPITPFTMVQIECCCCVHVVALWLCALGEIAEMCSEALFLFGKIDCGVSFLRHLHVPIKLTGTSLQL